MNNILRKLGAVRVALAVAAATALSGAAMAEYDFGDAWRKVDEAQGKGLPRTVTNLVEEISREAVAASRWPDAARAFLFREQAMREFTDGESRPDEWLPAFAASVDAQPAPLQAVLQLHLAHTYQENSNRWRWGGAAPTKLDDAAAKDKMPPWSPEKIAATLEAQFAKALEFEAELKALKMSDWTSLFAKGTLPESFCPTLFDFAVRDAIKFYGTTIPDKTLEKGFALYDKLIEFHGKDGNHDALAMAELDRAEYVRAFGESPQRERDDAFSEFLDGFISRWDGKTEAVAVAVAKKAELLRGRKELVAAHDIAAAYAAKWPKTLGGSHCAGVAADIESMDLSVEAERNWCAPWPEIEVKLRNLEKVFFRIVPVSFGDLVSDRSMGAFQFGRSDSVSAMKDKYLKLKPTREWTEKFALKPDYSSQTFRCPVPEGLQSGHYVLFAAANDKFGADDLPLFAQYVTVTSLALALDTGNGEFKGTVYRAESGEPVPGATVELWWYPEKGGRLEVLREKHTTDANGNFAADVQKGQNGMLYRHVRAMKDGDEVLSLNNECSGYVYDEDDSLEHVDLFTDRAIYRPGQEIKVKGIAYHVDPVTRDFRTQSNVTVKLALIDPNGKDVASAQLTPNKWGSFVHTFAAPEGRLTGGYTLKASYQVKNGGNGVASRMVSVEEYKRPKFTAELDKASDDAALGAPMTITGKALTYSGLPVQNAKVEWHVERTTRYPGWCSWFGFDRDDDGERFVAQGEAETDENGAFKVVFTPVASPTADLRGDPSFNFTVNATVTDGTGEARSAQQSFVIGTVAWSASVWAEGGWHTPERPVAVNVSLMSLAGTRVPVRGTLKAFRLTEPEKTVRKPAVRGRWSYDGNKKGPWDWKSWEVGDEVLSLEVGAANGMAGAPPQVAEHWKGELKLGVGAYRLVFETKDPQGKTVKDIGHVLVFDPSTALGMKMPSLFEVEKTHVKVGESLRAYWGTGYDTGCCRVKVTSNGKVVVDEMVGRPQRDGRGVSGESARTNSPRWYYELPIKDEHRGEIRIETTFVRENRIYHDHNTINVPWDNKYLKITAEHFTSRLVPGNEEKWTFKVSGPAEVLAFMYDKSLDAYRHHSASPSFSRYFTPSSRWLGTPSLHNALMELPRLDGRFARPGIPEMCWPFWRTLPRRSFRTMRKMEFRRREYSGEVMALGAIAAEAADMSYAAAPADASVMLAEVESGWSGRKAKAAGAGGGSGEAEDAPPRRNLKETAFFFPELETDAEGNVSFTFTAPDALTGWKLLMVAHDNELNSGIFRNDEIVTTKPLMCEPNAPRFAREGDDFLFAVKVTNTEDSPQSGEVELNVCELGRETIDERRDGKDDRRETTASQVPSFKSPKSQAFDLKPHESKTFEFRISIPDGCGYFKYVAKAKGEKFADGEEGVLPVLSRRILVREAVQLNARGNETKSFRLDNLLASKDSETIRHQDLTVRAVSRPAWYAVLSLPYLMEFIHECCEQTFSRYYANALGEFIANADPRIRETFDAWEAEGAECLKSPLETDQHLKAIALEATPWMWEAEHETAARARLGKLFGKERLNHEQERCLEKLRAARNGDGMWPWFPGGLSSDSITLYILTGFARLNHLAGHEYPDFFASAAAALDENVSDDVRRRLEEEKRGIMFSVNGFDVRWMYMHSFKGVAPAKDKSIVPLFVSHLRTEWQRLGLESQALSAVALKRMGEDGLAEEIMASIKERGVLSDELGMYWKVPYFFSSSVFAAPVSTQALIVEAFREVTGDNESADACNVWLLKQKQTQDWTTTAATADAIYALLLGGGTDLLAGDSLAEVALGGEKVVPEKAEKGTGMWSVRYAADAVKPEMGEIAFTGADERGVSWGGVHWSYFEDVLKVRAHEPKELSVEKKYYMKVMGPEGARLTAVEGVLEPGDEIVARLEVKSDRTYEFVHLADERPACAEPVDVISSYRWRDGVGYYQSTRDVATHYYIDRLNKGVFVLETSYRVQQRGVFTGGIATIQCMYAPEFTAHSSAESVQVGGGDRK